MQDSISIVNEEKRYFLRKLLDYEGISLNHNTLQQRASVSPSTSFSDHQTPVKQKRPNNSNARGESNLIFMYKITPVDYF